MKTRIAYLTDVGKTLQQIYFQEYLLASVQENVTNSLYLVANFLKYFEVRFGYLVLRDGPSPFRDHAQFTVRKCITSTIENALFIAG